MDYEALLNEVLNIGKEMVKSGAETNRAEDSIYRMMESYDIEQCNVFVIQSNIQATIKPIGGSFITQIRRVHNTGFNYDRLDYLNNLSRYICQNKPSVEEIREKYNEVMNRKSQPVYLQYLAAILGGVGFGVYFGCDVTDTIVGIVICALVEVYFGRILDKRENNLVVYNLAIAFLSAAAVYLAARLGFGHHPDRIILGLNMVLISGLGVTNGIRDVLNRAYISGMLNIAHACLGAVAIACGTGLAMMLFKGDMYEMYIAPSIAVQLISCGVASMGFALVFKAALGQSVCAGIGGFINCAFYLVVLHFCGNNLAAVMAGATSVAAFAYVMSRIHRAPATIFLTTSIMPVIPGATLFYMMHGLVQADYGLAKQQTLLLLQTCMAIAFGFLIVEIVTHYVSEKK
ncbi:MAG: threonine/serine exporter ThrE family protein [Lachnospiraceae bacterium]